MSALRWTHMMLVKRAEDNNGALRFSDVLNEKNPLESPVAIWMREEGIPPVYGVPVTHLQTQRNLFVALERFGYMERPGFILTGRGRAFAKTLDADWRNWPIQLPFTEDGEPDWPRARYLDRK